MGIKKHRQVVKFLLAALVVIPGGFYANQFDVEPLKEASRLESFLEHFSQKNKVGAAAVCVVTPEKGSLATFGTLSNTTTIAVNEYAFFPLGSLTQPFTALTLAHFVSLGSVDLDTAVSNFLPQSMELPSFKGRNILLGDLATNTSSLPNLSNTLWNLGHFTSSSMYRYLANYHLKAVPGSRWQISNMGYAFLSNLIARVGKKSYHDLVKEIVLNPLQLNETMFVLKNKQVRGLVMGYDSMQPVSTLKREKIYSVFLGANGLYSTPHDMLKWLRFCTESKKSELSKPLSITLKEYFDFPSFHLALPWKVISDPRFSEKIYTFSSSMFGYTHFIGFIPGKRKGVCLMSNQAGIELEVQNAALDLLAEIKE
ncbi:hypothetical protein COB21_03235 [Candidatus Aerophobetes bacterium]|uniref:Beta-lactamase-related domain-containing protein n=1 Tax=Aerophobetes bacterium TaxID=2030807 RepID=A0A2A4X443_UNCAE|nr:MAG: hypothetical protein COB21_03235 [Candidatus Aerophobetes bacterium]